MRDVGLVTRETVEMRERYDPVTKVWTQICAAMIAVVIDWLAVVVPVDRRPSQSPYWWWWFAATLIVALPSLSWTAGHIARRDHEGTIMWIAPALLVVCVQFVVWRWAVT